MEYGEGDCVDGPDSNREGGPAAPSVLEQVRASKREANRRYAAASRQRKRERAARLEGVARELSAQIESLERENNQLLVESEQIESSWSPQFLMKANALQRENALLRSELVACLSSRASSVQRIDEYMIQQIDAMRTSEAISSKALGMTSLSR